MAETLREYFPFEDGGLDRGEAFWRENYQFLLDHGYLLRPRYSPDWVPSWIGTNKGPWNCEDGIYLAVSSCIILLKNANLLFFLSVSRSVMRSTFQPALDAIFIHQYGILPNSLHTCIWAKPDQPKKQSIAVVPGLIRICNRVF